MRAGEALVLGSGPDRRRPRSASIEEYLGRNTRAYYDVLAEVGQGSWHPGNDARPWIRFCLTAHLRQARTTLRRAEESEDLWSRCEHEVEATDCRHGPRLTLFSAALGFRIRNPTHRAAVRQGHGEDISESRRRVATSGSSWTQVCSSPTTRSEPLLQRRRSDQGPRSEHLPCAAQAARDESDLRIGSRS
ncbi:MAG: hypothetical protein U0U69_12600 [Acidimicrobiia bacterium]